jgi:hypothetical protein
MIALKKGVSMKFFNTAGPVNCDMHYCLPPLTRFDLEEIEILIDQQKYFILHAPRQTGKTSCMLALMKHLNNKGKTCLYINVECAQACRENIQDAMRVILGEMASRAQTHLKNDFLEQTWLESFEKRGHSALNHLLTRWSEMDDHPKILIIDEIDSLIGDTLISVLRQLRAGYDKRPQSFPQSIILCGLRDVRDYRIHSSSEKTIITGGSAFNIKAKSLNLGNFSKQEMISLYKDHTHATGQEFKEQALEKAWEYSCGQPWIVNALGYEVTFEMREMRERSKIITADHIQTAANNLIIRRETHVDQLMDKLKEDRVKRVIEPILMNEDVPQYADDDDILYVSDLGLITSDKKIKIANRLYQEIIPRSLTFSTQLTINHEPVWYITDNGLIDTHKLLSAFQDFFRKHYDEWSGTFPYKESAMQLLLQAFLQRIINNGGYLFREYGLGRKRTDLLIQWPQQNPSQEIVIELKLRYGNTDRAIEKGLPQTWDYMQKCGATEGHLMIFDRRKTVDWDTRIFQLKESYKGRDIWVWGV